MCLGRAARYGQWRKRRGEVGGRHGLDRLVDLDRFGRLLRAHDKDDSPRPSTFGIAAVVLADADDRAVSIGVKDGARLQHQLERGVLSPV
jgi:hypothetical protein